MGLFKSLSEYLKPDEAYKTEQQRRVNVIEAAYLKLADLPQFIEVEDGLLNVMNGCLVKHNTFSLVLVWKKDYGSNTCDHIFYISGDEKIQKYLKAMQMQTGLESCML